MAIINCDAEDMVGVLIAAVAGQLRRDWKTVQHIVWREVAEELQFRVVMATDEKKLVDYGHYKLGWRVASPAPGIFDVRNDVPYAGVLEMGRRPGRPGPPLAPILEWVEHKLVPLGVVDASDAKQVAFAIRNKLHKQGMKGRFILRDTLKKYAKPALQRAVALHLPTP